MSDVNFNESEAAAAHFERVFLAHEGARRIATGMSVGAGALGGAGIVLALEGHPFLGATLALVGFPSALKMARTAQSITADMAISQAQPNIVFLLKHDDAAPPEET